MKAALPDDESDLLADAMDALRRAPLPPDAVQLPTSFELLGGGGIAGGDLRSPRLEAGGLEAGGGGGGGMEVGAGALPHQPGELTRSPSLEQLLSKVQRIDANQVRGWWMEGGWERWWALTASVAEVVGLSRHRHMRCFCCRPPAACVRGSFPVISPSLTRLPPQPPPRAATGHRAGQDWRGRLRRGVPGAVRHLRPGGCQVDQAHKGV